MKKIICKATVAIVVCLNTLTALLGRFFFQLDLISNSAFLIPYSPGGLTILPIFASFLIGNRVPRHNLSLVHCLLGGLLACFGNTSRGYDDSQQDPLSGF